MFPLKNQTQAFLPRIEISLFQIQENARRLTKLYGQNGIALMGVTKAVLGEPDIARAMIKGGARFIADSRIENIQRMKKAEVSTRFVLLRTPPSQAEVIVKNADISLNTELETLKKLSFYARKHNKNHQVIIMVELGDLREGVLPCSLSQFIRETLPLANIEIIGIGCNLACHGGIKPNNKKMTELSELTAILEREFELKLEIISGGNSANYDWYKSSKNIGRINNLRLGESILLGLETANRSKISGLHTGAFKLIAEVIESKKKPSLPYGETCQDAFGNTPGFLDRGMRERGIISLGRQDVQVSGIFPEKQLAILGASSDHIIFDNGNHEFNTGDEVRFDLDYSGLLAAMTSPFIHKKIIDPCNNYERHQTSGN